MTLPSPSGGEPSGAGFDASTALTWLLVLHPNVEVARARGELTRRAFPNAEVTSTCRMSEVAVWCARQREPGAVLVHMRGVDRFSGGWGGHRLVSRLVEAGLGPVVAWIDRRDVDGGYLATAVGASGLVCTEVLAEADDAVPTLAWLESAAVDRIAAVAHAGWSVGSVGADRALHAWFQRRYGRPWEPWIEYAAALLVGGGERTEQAELLRAHVRPPTTDHARRRLRQIGEVLCGEVRGNGALLRREALMVLEQIAHVRPIAAAPLTARSLQRAVRLLKTEPELAEQAGLSARELEDLFEVAAAELNVGLGGSGPRRGRPESGAWRVRRELALGRVAELRGERAPEKIAALDELREAIDRVVDAVHDTAEDRDRPAWLA